MTAAKSGVTNTTTVTGMLSVCLTGECTHASAMRVTLATGNGAHRTVSYATATVVAHVVAAPVAGAVAACVLLSYLIIQMP